MSVNFDGSLSGIDFGNILNFDKDDSFSVSFWMKNSGSNSDAVISNLDSSTNFRGWDITIKSSGLVEFFLINNATPGDNQIIVDGTSNLEDGAWHHVLVTYDGSEDASGVTIYVDGVDDTGATLKNTLSLTTVSAANLWMGKRPNNSQYYHDLIDELAVYDIEITSASDIANLSNPGDRYTPLDVQTANLVLYPQLDEGAVGEDADGDTIRDLSGNGYDGTGDDGGGSLLWGYGLLSYPSGPIAATGPIAALQIFPDKWHPEIQRQYPIINEVTNY